MKQDKPKVGRPRKWETREELIEEINDYFRETDSDKYTVTGLALALGTSRQTLDNYQAREEFKDIIDEAKLIVENSYELSLRENGRTGDIFALKNFGWEDRKKQEIEGDGVINVTIEDD